MARGQWTEVEARGVLEAWRRSGLPIERCARQRGLVPQRLYFWRKKLLAIEKARTAAAALLPVRVAAEPRRAAARP